MEVGMCSGWKDSVEPCLLVFMSWSCEGCARELLCVKTVRRFLRAIGTYGKGAFDGFGSRHIISAQDDSF